MRLAIAIVFSCACRDPKPWSDAWMLAEGAKYLDDGAARRKTLEDSLVNHENMYSRIRLNAYGRGWDHLPVWNPRSVPVTAARAAQLLREEMPEVGPVPLWDGKRPTTMEGWIALGRKVFTQYPMRAEVFAEYALTRPALAASVGFQQTARGEWPGLVVFANVDGETRVGITCAVCHSSVENGEVVLGRAHRSFDYGKLRVEYDRIHEIESPRSERMLGWGPGRADVTEDDDEDPVAIPDLWGLRGQPYLTQAGTIKQTTPIALAIRQETQLTDSNHQKVRPPRELAWALAMYVYSLSPPSKASTIDTSRGEAIFREKCHKCHSNASYGGIALSVVMVGTDPSLATGRGRGTGKYRVPQLLGVGDGAPYLHHGAVPSLEALFSPARLASSVTAGHRPGTDLSDADRTALIAYLKTL